MATRAKERIKLPCLKIRQWMNEWEHVPFDSRTGQTRPKAEFYLCSIKAGDLKSLTGVHRRTAAGGTLRKLDPNVQRGHEEERSRTIREFVKFGYPWCEMNDANRRRTDSNDLRKP